MKVSAVGFLFQNQLKEKPLKGKNYTCVIHKLNSEGNFNRNIITSPIVRKSASDVVSPEIASFDVLNSLNSITNKDSNSKFIGATIKDGVKETEIHSLLSDKIFAVRTKDEFGKNSFRILGKNKTKDVLSRNLCVNA